MKKRIGLILLGAWLILTGLSQLMHLNFSGMDVLVAILATASGVLLILGL